VFTAIVPMGKNVMESREARWAVDLGARVVKEISPTTTHLVGVSKSKTSKIKDAEKILASSDKQSRLQCIVHLGTNFGLFPPIELPVSHWAHSASCHFCFKRLLFQRFPDLIAVRRLVDGVRYSFRSSAGEGI